MKVHYDVLDKKGSNYESRFFTVEDAIKILKTSFMTHDDFVIAVKKSNNTDEDKAKLITKIYQFSKDDVFPSQEAKKLGPIIQNDNRLLWSNLFKYKILNFGQSFKSKPIFDFYINNESNLHFLPEFEGEKIKHKNSSIESGNLIIRISNWRMRNNSPYADYVDFDTKINMKAGMYDSQMRNLVWNIDEWTNKKELKLPNGEIYVMSPLLRHFVTIYDKMLFLSKQKVGFVRSILFKNAIEASFNDARIIYKMNDKYRFLNYSFVRIVPILKKKVKTSIIEKSRFFDYVNQQYKDNIYSYCDVISNGSGDSNMNKITISSLKEAVENLSINSIHFTKEENTMNGLFAFTDPGFMKVVADQNKFVNFNQSVLNSHMVHVDYENEEYVTAVNGDVDLMMVSPKKLEAMIKKFNQRKKLLNSRTLQFDENDAYNTGVIVKNVDAFYKFRRDVNYMNNDKDVHQTNSYARNALVAFVSSNIERPLISDLVNMEISEMNKWFYSLRGVACEGFFTKEFLSQRMLVDRTERLKVSLEETDDLFQSLVKDPSQLIGKTLPNTDKEKFFVRNYVDCQCGGKIVRDRCRSCNNPRPVDGEVRTDYWVDFSKGFDFVTLTGIRQTEDGIDVYSEYSIPLAHSRFKCEELTKSVPIQTAQDDIGYIKTLNLGDLSLSGVNTPLDGIYFGLGGFKSKTHGIPFTVLRAYNAFNNVIKYSSDDCINKTEEVNEFLSTFKKSLIVTKMYDKETGRYVDREVEAWVGIVALSPTEVSQEYNRSRTEEERSFSKANYALNNSLGFDNLNEALSIESNLFTNKSNDYRNELFKIAKIHASARPMLPDTEKAKELVVKHDSLIAGITNLNSEYAKERSDFNVYGFDSYSFRSYITHEEYKKIITSYPLFVSPVFENGFVINCTLGMDRKQSQQYQGTVYHTIYFPKREILMNMFEIIGDNSVKMNSLLTAYIGVFESLAVSRIGVAPGYNNNSPIQLVGKTGEKKPLTFATINGKILNAIDSLLFDKQGIINQITNIAVPRLMSKQVTDIDCPYDVAIIGNNRDYKKIVSRVLETKFPDREQDWTTPVFNKETREFTKPGWCWLEEVYGFAVREPNLFSKQNLNAKLLWSSYKADIEYKKNLGMTFHQKHPGSKGIYLNSVFVTFNLEGDVDGDVIFLGVPYTEKAQVALADVYEQIKEMKFFDKNNENEEAKFVRQTYLVPSLKYLLDESENLNFELDKLKIGYSRIRFNDSIAANFDAAGNKENIGFLTVSLWQVSLFIDFYMFNYNRLVAKGYEIPELSKKDKYELLFIFQYLLAQQNGVRAMKDDGSYGKITIDILVTNKEPSNSNLPARLLFENLIDEYKEENKKENISIDFSGSVAKLFMIFDKLFVSHSVFRGFGYMTSLDGDVFSYKSSKWASESRFDEKGNNTHVDCTDRYDQYFIDFQACFLLINGRNAEEFISKFGYEKTLNSLDFRTKPHMSSPLLMFAKDVFEVTG